MSKQRLNKFIPLKHACNLLYRAHPLLWLALLFMTATMILLFSYLLQLKAKLQSEERAQLGLVPTATYQLNNNPDQPLSLADGHHISKQLNQSFNVLVVPQHSETALKCRVYTQTSYIVEREQQLNGYVQWVEQKQYSWLPGPQFTLGLNQIDLSVSRPQLALQHQDGTIIGRYYLDEFDESALKLEDPPTGAIDSQHHYYFSYAHIDKRLGPYQFDVASGYFILLTEAELDPQQYWQLENSHLNQFVAAIYRHHLPFLPGAAIDQLQLSDYEYSLEQRQNHNQIMLNALLFDNNNKPQRPSVQQQNARTFFSANLFDKVFPNPFDFKTLKLECNDKNNAPNFSRIANIYGHYQLKPTTGQNPNQIFIPFDSRTRSQAKINSFLIKDLGHINQAITALEQQLQSHNIQGQVLYTKQALPSYHLFVFLTLATIVAMTAILLTLTQPLRKVMIQQLFVIKLYGGPYILAPLLSGLLLFPLAVGIAWGLGNLLMLHLNFNILAPYKVALVHFGPQYFVIGSCYVLLIWLLVWGWMASTMKNIIKVN